MIISQTNCQTSNFQDARSLTKVVEKPTDLNWDLPFLLNYMEIGNEHEFGIGVLLQIKCAQRNVTIKTNLLIDSDIYSTKPLATYQVPATNMTSMVQWNGQYWSKNIKYKEIYKKNSLIISKINEE